MSAPGISISFRRQIDAYAKNNGLDLSPDGADILDAVLRSALRTEGNRASFVIGTDRTGTIEEALAIHTEGTPRKAKASPAPIGPEANRTARAAATNGALRSTEAETKAAMAVDLVAKFGNPWRSGNRTHQAFITNTNPTLAKHLHDTAGL